MCHNLLTRWPRLLRLLTALSLLLGTLGPLAEADAVRAADSPTVWTGKADYAPDEVVDLFGAGWQPNELIQLTIDDDEGKTWRHTASISADAAGAFEYEFQLPSWFVATYSVVARGATSGMRTTSFTDDIARGAWVTNFNGTGDTASSQLTINAPSVSTGDLLVAQITIAKDFSASNTICPPQGWLAFPLQRVDFELKIIQQIFYYVAPANQPNTSYTWQFKTTTNCQSGLNRSNTGASGGIIRYSGVNTTAPIEAHASAAGSSSPPYRAPSVATSSPNAQVIRFFSAFKNTTINPSTNRIYTVGSAVNAERTVAAFDAAQASPGPSGTFDASFASSAEWVAHTVALRPAPIAPTRLAFTTPQRTGSVNECIGPITVQTQNASGAAAGVTAATTINLLSSGAGSFFSADGCTAAIAGLALSTGASAASFYYRPSARGTGSHTLTASAPGLTSASQAALVSRASQATLSVTGPTSGSFGDRLVPTASGGSGSGAVSFAVVSGSTACSLPSSGPDAGKLLISSGSGSCQITATKAADDDYASISSAPFTVAVSRAAQSISFAPDSPTSKTTADAPFGLSATASSGLPVSFAAEAGSSCAVSAAGQVSSLGVGTCTVIASQDGDANYSPAPPAQWQIVVGAPPRVAQTISFEQPASPATFGSSFLLSPAASSGLPVNLVATGACSAAPAAGGYQVTMTSGSGDCILTASQDGNASFLAAAEVVRAVQAAPAQPFVVATGGQFTYSGSARAGSGEATGLGGVALGPVTLSYWRGSEALAGPPSDAGSYTVIASFPGDANYAPASDSAALVIAPLTVSGSFSVADKLYDGTSEATISGRTLQGVLGDDVVLLVGGAASFADKNAGQQKAVSGTGFSLSGADERNYLLGTVAGASASIAARPLTVSATGADKVYDATTGALVTLSDNRVAGDSLTVSYASASFADKNVGREKPVTVAGISLGGADAGNYELSGAELSATASISPAPLTASISAADKDYDGTPAATISGRTLQGVLGDDMVLLVGGTASFADKNVGREKLVTAAGFSLGGADAGNYELSSAELSATASIEPRRLLVSATGVDKVYDGAANAQVVLSDNRVAGDSLQIGYASASFADKEIGANKPVSVAGITLGGDDAKNYVLANTTASTTASITQHLYRARQVGQRVWVERNVRAGGIGDFDGDPVDGWALVGRTNGAADNGDLRGFFVRDGVPYAIVFNRSHNKGNRCILLTPTSLSVVQKGQTRLMLNVDDRYLPCPTASAPELP